MFKFLLMVAGVLAFHPAHAEATLRAQEIRWLRAAEPVIAYARQLGLPVDIIVQPQARPEDVPFAMGYDGKRCKLVLSMRGGADADAILSGVAPDLQQPVMEAVAAHEFAHCWRYVQGSWQSLPAGFTRAAASGQQREEAYADLAALAWSARTHPVDYARIHAWLWALRADHQHSAGAHDTRAWISQARETTPLGSPDAPFANVEHLWRRVLLSGD